MLVVAEYLHSDLRLEMYDSPLQQPLGVSSRTAVRAKPVKIKGKVVDYTTSHPRCLCMWMYMELSKKGNLESSILIFCGACHTSMLSLVPLW